MKKVLVAVFMLAACIFLYQGSSQAVVGVADDVPGTDQVIPFVCGIAATNGLNTLWATADAIDAIAESADVLVYDPDSILIYDARQTWTGHEVIASDCKTLVAGMSVAQKAALEVDLDGDTVADHYLGYLIYFNDISPNDVFVTWEYLVDLTKGFASGFNAYSVEVAVSTIDLSENAVPITATEFYPRYYLLNSNADTWNWWIVLTGDNFGGTLDGFVCNEEEDCISLTIIVPTELVIINVDDHIPALLHAAFPKAGFAFLSWTETTLPNDDTTLMWSYQREQATTVQASWDVIHPVHALRP
jgi:hypothetical protein